MPNDKQTRIQTVIQLLDIHQIIIFEDDFHQENLAKNQILYDYLCLTNDERNSILKEIADISSNLAEIMLSFYDKFLEIDMPINENDAIGQADQLIKKRSSKILEDIYDQIDEKELYKCNCIFTYYGIGLPVLPNYMPLFDLVDNLGNYFPKRIFVNYLAEDQKKFSELLTINSRILIVIDDYIQDTYQAKEIIKQINQSDNHGITALIYSSKDHTKLSEVNNSNFIYIDYVNKAEKLEQGFFSAINNSGLVVLKNEYRDSLDSIFSNQFFNSSVVQNLQDLAEQENTPSFLLLKEWFRSIENLNYSQNFQTLIKMLALTNNLIDLEKKNFDENTMNLIFHSRNFDDNINKLCLAPLTGDIFENQQTKELYLLVGQDCDLSIRPIGDRRNYIFEFVKIEAIPHTKRDRKGRENKALDFCIVENFNDTQKLKIDLTQRYFLRNEIIDLCMYNKDGYCRIDLVQDIPQDILCLLTKTSISYLKDKLIPYYVDLLKVNGIGEKIEFLAHYSHQCEKINILDFEQTEQTITYPLKRLSRIQADRMLLINKLFYEYRGRLAYTTIEMPILVEK